MERLLWYVFAGSRGGPTRVRIMRALLAEPRNVNQLARLLSLDYKTVEYNLRVLVKHVLVVRYEGGGYGAPYFPSKNLLAARSEFDRISASFGPAGPPAPTAPGTAQSGKT